MKFSPEDPPRIFEVGGPDHVIQMRDCGRIELEPDEQVTFLTHSGAEYDVARKSWGFYATPSLSGRLRKFNLRSGLIRSPGPKYYIFLIERGKEEDCFRYMAQGGHNLVCWLDDDEALDRLERRLNDD